MAATKGQLYLRIYLSIGRSHVSPPQKLHVVERRGIDIVTFECGALKKHSETFNCWSNPGTPILMPKSAASILSGGLEEEQSSKFPFNTPIIQHKQKEVILLSFQYFYFCFN